LQKEFEEFAFADEALAKVLEKHNRDNSNATCWTAISFLEFIIVLRCIVLQDAAYILEFHPERAHHPLFLLNIFDTDLFKEFWQQMRQCEQPADKQIDLALPGVLQHLQSYGEKTDTANSKLDSLTILCEGNFHSLHQAVMTGNNSTLNRVGAALTAAGTSLSQNSLLVEATQVNGALPSEEMNAPEEQPATAPYPGYGYEPDWTDLKTIQSVYNQWHGKGNYTNRPIAGGLKQLESTKKAQWRAKWCKEKPNQSKAFSRMKKIMNDFDPLVIDLKYSEEDAIAVMQSAMDRFKSFSALADKIGKVNDAMLYQVGQGGFISVEV
jgi:hypothetical protein